MSDKQRKEWEAFENSELAKGRCPYSGEYLVRRIHDDGPADPTGNVMSCDLCDCFGFGVDDERIPVRVRWWRDA